VADDTFEDGIYYKVCVVCSEKKVRGLYYKHSSFPDGFNTKCKSCSTLKDYGARYVDAKFAEGQRLRYGYAKI
jgi:hypothetical protein